MDIKKRKRARISALSDDALPEKDYELARADLRSADGMSTWEIYHLIRDVLRRDSVMPSPGFAKRMSIRLAAEPLIPCKEETISRSSPSVQVESPSSSGFSNAVCK
jgi:negative regulator of sigma E activity